MFEDLKADLTRWCKEDSSVRGKVRVVRKSFGFRAIAVYRFGRWIDSSVTGPWMLPLRYALLAVYHGLGCAVARAFGIRIDRRASLGRGFRVLHFGGVMIGPCHVGENCSVHQHVRLGDTSSAGSTPGPVIGRNVWIGPHARVAGPVRVGDNVTISAGAVVTRDIKSGCLVAGDPARPLSLNYDNSELLGVLAVPEEPPQPAGVRGG